jgi:uncharacterized protein (TIGR02099 family)
MIRKATYVTAASVILVAAVVVLSYFFTPLLDEHKSEIEVWAGDLLKMPVQIQKVRLSWYRYQPEISLNQVVLFNKETKHPIIQIKKVMVFFSIPQSIWHRTLVPTGIMISGADVNVYQKASGEVALQGLTFASDQSETKFTDVIGWLSQMPRLILNDIDLHYTSMRGIKRFLTLFNLRFENDGNSHAILGKAILHQEAPTEVTLTADWRGETTALNKIDANVYLFASGLSLSQWWKGLAWHGWQLNSGNVNAKIWVHWDAGSFRKIQCRFESYGLELFSETNKSTHKISRLSGEVGWKREGNNQIIAGDDIFIDLPSHLWPSSSFYISLSPDASGKLSPTVVNVGYVNLADVQQFIFASKPILPEAVSRALLQLKPTGDIDNLSIVMSGEPSDWQRLTLDGRFSRLSVLAWRNFPGIDNLSGGIKWDGEKGDLSLDSRQTIFQYDAVFANPISVDQLTGNVLWKKDPSGTWIVTLRSLQALNADLELNANGTLNVPSAGSAVADLQADFTMQQAGHVARYLPMSVFEPDLVTWLKGAFLAGTIPSGHAVVRGTLSDFPFDKNNGQFLVTATTKDLKFRYAPDWPILSDLSAQLSFSGRKMLAEVDHAILDGIQVGKVRGVIPNLGGDDPQLLTVDGVKVQTDFSNGLHFVHTSPLEKTIGKMFAGASVSGPMDLSLSLIVPLSRPDDTRVNGDIDFKETELNLEQWRLLLKNVHGNLHFTEKSTDAKAIQAELFGKPLSFDLLTVPQAKAAAIVRAIATTRINLMDIEQWLKLPLSSIATGETDVKTSIDFSLKAPIKILVNSNLKGVDVTLPEPYAKKINQTRNFVATVTAQEPDPLQVKLNYGDLTLKIAPYDDYWDVGVSTPGIEGQLQVPASMKASDTLTAQFAKLNLSSIPSVSGFSKTDVRTLPSIVFSANDVSYNNKQIGRVNFKTSPSAAGLTIKSLDVVSPHLELNAKGDWSKSTTHLQGKATSSNVSRLLTQLGFDAHNFVSSNGRADFNLSWKAAPYALSFAAMSGRASLDLGKGRIVELSQTSGAKMDLGRMLSIFSLQTIPRRLSLDFSDVFQKGYSFDLFKGDFKFENGSAYTSNTRFDGPVARVDIYGRIGIVEQDYDFTLSVTPHVTSSIPVAATLITGQPVIGIAAWAVDKVISTGVSKATTYYYAVNGPWANPAWNAIKTPRQ